MLKKTFHTTTGSFVQVL